MEFDWLIVNLVRMFQPETYVEIGISVGHTFNQVVKENSVSRLIAVDIHDMPFVVDDPHVEKYQMSSQEFAQFWSDPIDILFIDGNHSCEVVEHDFYEIGKWVRPGTGLILMHDTHPVREDLFGANWCGDAWKFADSLYQSRNDHSYELVTIPGPFAGLTIVRKRSNHHLAWRHE